MKHKSEMDTLFLSQLNNNYFLKFSGLHNNYLFGILNKISVTTKDYITSE